MESNTQPDEKPQQPSFRDAIATVDKAGKRIWIYPKKPFGTLHMWRQIVAWGLLALLFCSPWIRIGGEPLVLMDVINRKYVLFGQVFWPQDFYIFIFGMLAFMVFIIVFTVIFGRVFCGWVCPQTIFMESVFRKIEYWIEGDWTHQKKLNKQPWNREKILKKSAKQLIFFGISFLIANTFLAYFIGSDALLAIQLDDPREHVGGLTSLLVFTGVFYGVFSQLREQVCTTVCPYGRLQGVLLDRDSIVVAYDYVRGEDRAKIRKNEDRKAASKGDCIDCHQCVDVCPTGIDIRNGTQLECVNCTACIDICNHMMDNVGLDRGLIRLASENQIANQKPWHWTARMKAYGVVLVLLLGVMAFTLVSRKDVDAKVLRAPGLLYQLQEDNKVSNLYNYKVINKTNRVIPLDFRLADSQGTIQVIGNDIIVPEQGMAEGAMIIYLPREELTGMKTTINIEVWATTELMETMNTNFIGPAH